MLIGITSNIPLPGRERLENANTCSFIDSLSAKVHPTPPTVDSLSHLFQDFYETASSHINTHISALASRQARESSPAPSRAITSKRFRAKATSLGSTDSPRITLGESEMMTSEELAEKRRARRALEHKRRRLEEAVERRLCEGVYGKIYRHRSTQDEAQDDKLRSKAQALSVVGIDLRDLGVDLGPTREEAKQMMTERPEELKKKLGDTPSLDETHKVLREERVMEMREKLENARKALVLMHETRYPLGKIHHLKETVRCMLDALARFHPKASADEIMPMMIYTLVTMPRDDINAISDLRFIQYFRWERKLNGEAAYCMTTLEAAIAFLETVDLSTLRADEAPSGPPRVASQSNTPRAESFPQLPSSGLSAGTLGSVEMASRTPTGAKPLPSPSGLRAAVQLQNRRLSDLVNTPAQAFTSASDSIFTTADHGLKTISATMGDSYKFLLGKLGAAPAKDGQELVVPKTIDDARKLVSTPPPDDDGSVSGSSSIHSPEDCDSSSASRQRPLVREEKVMSLIGGKKVSRDHSVDSSRSANSSKKVLFAEEKSVHTPPLTPSGNPALVESMKSLGSSLNPMARLSGISLARFGRMTPTSTPAVLSPALKDPPKTSEGGDLASVCPLNPHYPRLCNPTAQEETNTLLSGFPRNRAFSPAQGKPQGCTTHQAVHGTREPGGYEAW